MILARVLLVRPWVKGIDPLVASLRSAGIEPAITQIDREPALNAALARDRFDVVIFDPDPIGPSRATVEACLRANGRELPIVELDTGVADAVLSILRRD